MRETQLNQYIRESFACVEGDGKVVEAQLCCGLHVVHPRVSTVTAQQPCHVCRAISSSHWCPSHESPY